MGTIVDTSKYINMANIVENEFECRLCSLKHCGENAIESYSKVKHSGLIKKVTGIDVLRDVSYAPQNVCHMCVKRLKRELNKIQKKAFVHLLSWNVPNFEKPKPTKFELLSDELSVYATRLEYKNCSVRNYCIFLKVTNTGEFEKKVIINSDLSWQVYYYEKKIPITLPAFVTFDRFLNSESAKQLLLCMSNTIFCAGITGYDSWVQSLPSDSLFARDGQTVVGYRDNTMKAIRATQCPYTITPTTSTNISNGNRCTYCDNFSNSVRARASKAKRNENAESGPVHNNTPFMKLNSDDKTEKMVQMSKTIRNLRQEVGRLKKTITRMVTMGISLETNDDQPDLVMDSDTKEISEQFHDCEEDVIHKLT